MEMAFQKNHTSSAFLVSDLLISASRNSPASSGRAAWQLRLPSAYANSSPEPSWFFIRAMAHATLAGAGH